MKPFQFADELLTWLESYAHNTCSVLWCGRIFCCFRQAGHWVARDVGSDAMRLL